MTSNATWRLDNLTSLAAQDAAPKAVRWLERGGRRPLILGGDPGTGKTALAVALAHRYWDGGRRPVVFVDCQALIGEIDQRERVIRRRLDNASQTMLVILDDLRPSAGWPSAVSEFTSIVNRLQIAGAKLIVTTNLTKAERKVHLDGRLHSRLERQATTIGLEGEDLRGEPVPPPPPSGPCPYHCSPPRGFLMGHLANCDDPEIAALTVEFIEAEMRMPGLAPYYGLVAPDEVDYPSGAEGDEAYRRHREMWAKAFDWHAENTWYWCPHHRPDRTGPWLAGRLAALKGPLVLDLEDDTPPADEQEGLEF